MKNIIISFLIALQVCQIICGIYLVNAGELIIIGWALVLISPIFLVMNLKTAGII